MKLKHSILLLTLTALIAGCGLKGDLYLPEDQPQVVNDSPDSIESEKATESLSETENENEKSEDGLHYQPTESSVPQ